MTASRPLILLSNDDGVRAPGILAAEQALRPLADVVVAAPDRERSATSHSISLDRPLRAEEERPGVYSIDGTPVDCVYLALLHLVPRPPDLVVSGINHGYNLGSDVFYSGTVAAAVEGALRGVAGIAVSLQRQRQPDFGSAAAFLRRLAEAALERKGRAGELPTGKVLNVNVPAGDVTAFEVTFLGRRVYRDLVDVRQDLRGRSYYWIGGPEAEAEDVPGSDMSAVKSGRASVTPLMLDLTDRELLDHLRGWQLTDFARHEGPAKAVLQIEEETGERLEPSKED
jgi:5'-nucleotidase